MRDNVILENRLKKIVIDGDCWIWTGSKAGGVNPQSRYGVIGGGDREGKTTKYVHRYMYEVFNGPIPDDMLICHTCDVRLCCNPDHLFVGTRSDNMRDMVSKGRENPATRKLTEEAVRAIRADTRTNQAIADEYGTAQSTISRIKSGFAYRHVK